MARSTSGAPTQDSSLRRSRNNRSHVWGFVVVGWSAAILLGINANGCGSDGSTFPEDDGSSGTSGASGASGGFGEGGNNDDDVQQPPSDAPLNAETACAQASAQTQFQPLDLFVTLDHTASMAPDCPLGSAGTSLWCRATNALSTYFKSPSATNNAAALQFFNLNALCDGSGHGVSAVPGGATGYVTLPSTMFDTALDTDNPTGGFGTRTESAIRGLTTFTANPLNRRAGRSTIGIIVTDGDPTNCDTNPTNLSNLLQTHFTATTVRTFLIGMTGANDATLEAIAVGGNAPTHPTDINGLTGTCGTSTSPCRHWNVGDGNGTVLIEALKAIQAASVGCSLAMPKPDAGTIDLNQVKVEYSPQGNPPAQQLTKVANAGACVPNGFYYDDNNNPTTVNLCPQICATVQADPNAKVNVLFGCIIGGTTSGGIPK